jgi:SAM-dependent methyltransferase
MKNIDPEQLVKEVKRRYGKIAAGRESSCCAPASSTESAAATSCCGATATEVSGGLGYETDELKSLPEGADMGLGCGAPIDYLDLKPGEVVLDLGSGGGIDVFLAANQVGPDGRVIGVDMTPEMIERAKQNADNGGFDQVEFRLGRLEDLPVDDNSIDAVTSNCVINLVPDKQRVFNEIARVLKPGGRLVISVTNVEIFGDVDFVAATEDHIPDDLTDIMESTGIGLSDIRGKVHSVTFRAAMP